MSDITYIEEKATFQTGTAFFNPQAKLARDLGVLTAALHRLDRGQLRVIDAMAGCGIRSLRYCLESQADWVWVNDSNPDLQPTLQHNLITSIDPSCYRLTAHNANRIFFDCYNQQDFYDFVDLDCFGAPGALLQTCLWSVAIGGLLYLTSTDGRGLTGHAPISGLAMYDAYARSHPAIQEQGLRILLGSLQQAAATKGMGIEPVFSLFAGNTYRLMVRLVATPQLSEQNYGFLGYCHACGNYQTVAWRNLGRDRCMHDQHHLSLSGPLWLGNLHSPEYLQRLAILATQRHWTTVTALLKLMAAEATFPPYFYRLGEIGRRGKMDIPARSQLIATLQSWGYQASATSIEAQAIKTNANVQTCILAARSLLSQS